VAGIFIRSAKTADAIDQGGILRVKAGLQAGSEGRNPKNGSVDRRDSGAEGDERHRDDQRDEDSGDDGSQRAYGWRVGEREFEIRSPMTLTKAEYAEIEAFVLYVLKLRVKGEVP
jgi:hypothetical protein